MNSNLHSLILPILLQSLSITTAQLHADIIVILHDFVQCQEPNQDRNHKIRHIKQYFIEHRNQENYFLDSFKLASDQTRVGLIVNKGGFPADDNRFSQRWMWNLVLPLTGHGENWTFAWNNLVKPIDDCRTDRHDEEHYRARDPLAALQLAKREFDYQSPRNKPKIICIISQAETQGHPFAHPSAPLVRELKTSGVEVFMAQRVAGNLMDGYIRRGKMDRGDWTPAALDLFSNLSAHLTSNHSYNEWTESITYELVPWFVRNARNRFCQYDYSRCFYTVRGACERLAYAPRVYQYGDCQQFGRNPQPESLGVCPNPDECRRTCDEMWPWNAAKLPACGGSVCGSTQVRRNGSAPYPHLERCPHQYECPPCPSSGTRRPGGSERPTLAPGATYGPEEPDDGCRIACDGRMVMMVIVAILTVT